MRRLLVPGLLFLALLGLRLSSAGRMPAVAQVMTPFPTPTPLPDGRIIYVVRPGDTLWRISAISGVPVEELMALNNLKEGDTLQPGDSLLLGYALPGFATPTPMTTPSPMPVTPTPTPEPGRGEICVILYEDKNGNGMYDEGQEPYLAGAEVSVQAKGGKGQVLQEVTREKEPVCFPELKPGVYQVAVGLFQGWHPTTQMNYTVQVLAGNRVYMSFGAQRGQPQAEVTGGGGKAWWAVGAGAVLIGAGMVLLVVSLRLRRR